MIGNPRYGIVGLIGAPLMLFTEALAPLFELLGLVTLIGGVALGTFSWEIYVVFLGSMTFGLALLTSAAVLLEDISTRAYRLRHLVRLIALGPIELLVYRPILIWARLQGMIGFLRGRRDWDKFERNIRSPAGPLS
jgi:hypothetical protein